MADLSSLLSSLAISGNNLDAGPPNLMTYISSLCAFSSFLFMMCIVTFGIAGLGIAIGSLVKSVGWSIAFMFLDISIAGAPGTGAPRLGRPLGTFSSLSYALTL